MKRFRFRLQKYLNLKVQQERLARLEVARARAAYMLEVNRLQEIEEKTGELLAQGREALRGSILPELLVLCSSCLQVQERLACEQQAAVERAKDQLREEQGALLRVRQDRRLLERLRMRRWEAYYAEFLRSEQKTLDEIGSILFTRR
ncbi:MAG: flagellar protein FliJ [Thermacetogenium sp.]|nr:flagellar protein FliJ [Thermacetogenium sp.]